MRNCHVVKINITSWLGRACSIKVIASERKQGIPNDMENGYVRLLPEIAPTRSRPLADIAIRLLNEPILSYRSFHSDKS